MLVAASLTATITRYVAMRTWVFTRTHPAPPAPSRAGPMSAHRSPRGAVCAASLGRAPLLAVLALAAVLCLWNLTINGYSNEYYAAAARAGSESWKAWFFGAIDPGCFITVDKPPLSLWLMGLSARVFGFSSFAILLPQALCTIAAVGVLFATVRRVAGPGRRARRGRRAGADADHRRDRAGQQPGRAAGAAARAVGLADRCGRWSPAARKWLCGAARSSAWRS